MHVGNNYSLKEVILWTRRDIFTLLILATIPTVLFELFEWRWLHLPWLPIALLGTAVAFVVGFKNNASYERLWEARKIWGGIVNASRSWSIMVKDYVTNRHASEKRTAAELSEIHKQLYHRHFAWLTALRFQLREKRAWESIYKPHNREFKDKWFQIDEHQSKLEDALKPYLSEEEYAAVMSKTNRATQINALQSTHLQKLLEAGLIEDFRHMDLQKMLVEFYALQGASERIKNFPYPRQYATVNLYFTKLFVLLLPLGMLLEFEKFGAHMVWLTIPFSVLSGWVFTTLEKIGEASESPFEGSANDVPITALARTIEIDMREMLNEENIPKPITAKNNILS
ncbi:MAG: multidrug transporter [Flammeovirgaceae bacterium]|nr:multidrug transporter [Flammeovirgaceae bacterium]